MLISPQMSTGVVLPDTKKVKVNVDGHSTGTSVASDATKCSITTHVIDIDGFIDNSSKKCKEYSMKDLPVPSDPWWSCAFISTLTHWCGIQPNIWAIVTVQGSDLIFSLFYLSPLVSNSLFTFTISTMFFADTYRYIVW